MKNLFRVAASAAIVSAVFAAMPAHAAINDDVHECKFVRGQEGINACNRLFTDKTWGENETSWLYFGRGTDYLMLGQYQQALSDLTEAIRQAPAYLDAYLNRAQIYLHLDEYQLAKADLDKVISIPTSSTYIQIDNGDPRSVRYRATPADDAHMGRARLEIDLGDIDGAIADADIARSRAPNNPNALSTSCWAHALKADQLDKALVDCNDAVDANSESSNFLFRRGLVHYRMNDFAAAVKDFDQALTIDPKYASPLYMRGLAKAKSGDAAGGKADIDAAAVIRPTVASLFTPFGITP
jgi:tetratricopeptide (TPR) repeat protein